jgi:hypothetical protein
MNAFLLAKSFAEQAVKALLAKLYEEIGITRITM